MKKIFRFTIPITVRCIGPTELGVGPHSYEDECETIKELEVDVRANFPAEALERFTSAMDTLANDQFVLNEDFLYSLRDKDSYGD
jgi:hypothetical protein